MKAQSSWYISEIEKLLKSQGIDINRCESYNQIFDERDDTRFLIRLKKYRMFLQHGIDARNMDDERDIK